MGKNAQQAKRVEKEKFYLRKNKKLLLVFLLSLKPNQH